MRHLMIILAAFTIAIAAGGVRSDDVFRMDLDAPVLFQGGAPDPDPANDPLTISLASSGAPVLQVDKDAWGSIDLSQFATLAGGDGTVDVDDLSWSYTTGAGQTFPSGMTLVETTGVIEGTPEVAGTHSFDVAASHPSASINGHATYSIEVVDVAYAAETQALLSRMSVQPDSDRADLIDSTITRLKDTGLWDAIDVLYFPAAHDEQAARLNWKSASYGLTGAAIFTVDAGLVRNGIELSTGWVPSAGGFNFGLINAHLGAWIGPGNGVSAIRLRHPGSGTNHAAVNRPAGGAGSSGYVNGGSSVINDVPAQGHVAISRIGNDVRLYGNGVVAGVGSSSATGMVGTDLVLFASGSNNAPVLAAHAGRGLNSLEMQALSAIINDYVAGL